MCTFPSLDSGKMAVFDQGRWPSLTRRIRYFFCEQSTNRHVGPRHIYVLERNRQGNGCVVQRHEFGEHCSIHNPRPVAWVFDEALRCHKVIEAKSAVPRHIAGAHTPVRIPSSCFYSMHMAEAVNEFALFEAVCKRVTFFLCGTCGLGQVFGAHIPDVFIFAANIEVSAPHHRLAGRFKRDEIFLQSFVPDFCAECQPLQFVATVWHVRGNKKHFWIFYSDRAPFLVHLDSSSPITV
mmetsp:Transcript_79490/g.128774  ORF Transcript_79490/g.128774 Transcript_79490/m.128774 type:complete len:237 (-) Transcript_79490:40-750(-)